jgi:hypothetical protein
MSSLAIVLGFAFMVFLPCAIALMGSREDTEEAELYYDRLADVVAATRVIVNAKVEAVAPVAATVPATAATPAAAKAGSAEDWGNLGDPRAPVRGPKTTPQAAAPQPAQQLKQARVEKVEKLDLAEAEALKAHAIAARAHAEVLAAIARAATAKAEAAAAKATAAEQEAVQAIQDMRRAA